MTKLAVLGPGLLGGSLALAARRTGDFHVALWARRPEAVEELRELQIADEAGSDLAATVDDADVVVLCVPVGAMPSLAEQLCEFIKPGALITDVGSVKAPVVRELSEILAGRARFIGSHPMAGSEQSGVRAARADLFDGAVCIVTPDENSEPTALTEVTDFWRRMGCNVRELAPEAHDRTIAAVSHLPHLVAAALVNAVGDEDPGAVEFAGPGFRDTTRVASGPPEMWTEIFLSNRDAVRNSTEAMIAKLRHFITLLDRGSADGASRMNDFLTQAKAQRDRLRISRDSRFPDTQS